LQFKGKGILFYQNCQEALLVGEENATTTFSQFISPNLLQRLPRAQIRFFLASTIPGGNAMIDASVENLMDRQATHRPATFAWKSLQLSPNHVDNCLAVINIPRRQITTSFKKIIQLWDKPQNQMDVAILGRCTKYYI